MFGAPSPWVFSQGATFRSSTLVLGFGLTSAGRKVGFSKQRINIPARVNSRPLPVPTFSHPTFQIACTTFSSKSCKFPLSNHFSIFFPSGAQSLFFLDAPQLFEPLLGSFQFKGFRRQPLRSNLFLSRIRSRRSSPDGGSRPVLDQGVPSLKAMSPLSSRETAQRVFARWCIHTLLRVFFILVP